VELTFSTIKRIWYYFLEILFPSLCLGCKTKGEILCSNCIIKINRNKREMEDNIIALFEYHNPLIKNIIWNLKYYHHPYLGKKLGEILYEEVMEDISEMRLYTQGSPILVIPVPVSKNKMKIRGYNQAEKIASGFCEKGGKKVFKLKNNIINKKTETIPQARINNRARRLKNIAGSFEINNPKDISGQTIIIIDDVTTTGGTLNEIIKLLKESGAKKVIGLAIAH
jgi:ComF family protein